MGDCLDFNFRTCWLILLGDVAVDFLNRILAMACEVLSLMGGASSRESVGPARPEKGHR